MSGTTTRHRHDRAAAPSVVVSSTGTDTGGITELGRDDGLGGRALLGRRAGRASAPTSSPSRPPPPTGTGLRAGNGAVGDLRRRHHRPRRHRPGRRRQRAGHLPVPDVVGLRARRVRHHPLPGADEGRDGLPAHHRCATSTPTFGSTLGAQLLDVYVHRRRRGAHLDVGRRSRQRNYSIAPADAWSQRLEVQGFAPPVWVDAAGNQVGAPAVVASTVGEDDHDRRCREATFGTPAPGWSFTVALTGQDGNSRRPGPRRSPPTPQEYQLRRLRGRVARRRSARSTRTPCRR